MLILLCLYQAIQHPIDPVPVPETKNPKMEIIFEGSNNTQFFEVTNSIDDFHKDLGQSRSAYLDERTIQHSKETITTGTNVATITAFYNNENLLQTLSGLIFLGVGIFIGIHIRRRRAIPVQYLCTSENSFSTITRGQKQYWKLEIPKSRVF